MRQKIKKTIRRISVSIFAMLTAVSSISAAPVARFAAGANAAAIQAVVDQFRADLGTNNGVGGSFTSGRREINWDGVPDAFSEPNALPNDFFNVNSPRGVVFQNPLTSPQQQFGVSATQASGTVVRFGNIDAGYSTIFQTFSVQRLFRVRGNNEMEILFFVPGTNIPATVSGFGAVFCDVDVPGITLMDYYDASGKRIDFSAINTTSNGLSFRGVSFNAGERIAKVVIRLGNANLQTGNVDGVNGVDVVAMDDFIYGEPRALQFHSGDADGDGTADARIFRPSVGTWYTLNSGSNTISIDNWGLNGDIPVDGDFDGDSRADLAIFRPSSGAWFVSRSSDGTVISQSFGTTGDKPVAGDYDKDGKTDIAVWRPSNGNYFVLRSSDNLTSFFSFPFGQNGDIPVQGGAQ